MSFLHLRWSFYLKIECVLISFWDLFHSKTAANTHKRKKKKLFKTLRLYLVHKAFVEYITIFFVKHLVPTYKVNIWEVHFARWRERDCGGELLLTESKVVLPNPRKVLGGKKNHRVLVPEWSYSHLIQTFHYRDAKAEAETERESAWLLDAWNKASASQGLNF